MKSWRDVKNWLVIVVLGLSAAVSAVAADFRSVTDDAAIVYAQPTLRADKLSILGRFYPLELVSQLGDWAKVRDATGQLGWIEARLLGAQRMVLVMVPTAEVRREASDNSPIVFWAEQNVALELVEPNLSSWVKVRHRDGATGFVLANQLWGL